MLVDERRSQILQLVENMGFVSIHDLGDQIGASESTLRRDLEYLDGIGQVRKTRGGAAYVGESLTTFDERRSRAREEKRQIARAAAGLIGAGETVLLDGGTTTLEVARALVGKPLQVVTNSLPIVNLLVNQPGIELIVIGGFLYPKTGVNLGPQSVRALESIHAARLIMSVGGITQRGLFNSNTLLVETERAMMQSAGEVIVVTDSGKLGSPALAHLCPLQDVDLMIVDSEIPPEWERTLHDAGVELLIAND